MFKKINVKIDVLFHSGGLLVLCVIFFLSACSGTKSIAKTSSSHQPQPTESEEKRTISVLDLQAVQGIKAITPKLAIYRAVLVGESHTSYGDHLNQLAVIKNLHKQAQWQNEMVIGLEFIQQPFQKVLDEYVACRLSELDMLQQTQWYKRWKYDFRLYRPIFEFARLHKIPLIALNVPTELTKRISKVGINGLTVEQRQQLPKTIDKSNTAYETHLRSIFQLHAHAGKNTNTHNTSEKGKKDNKNQKKQENDKKFDYFYEAQLAWDEGMASTAARYLLKHPKRRMVLLAGGGHMINRHGIPARLERRLGSKVAVVLNDTGRQPNASQGDFLLLSSVVKLPKAGLLGVLMSQEKKGVVISALMSKGAAKKAGLKKGDVLVAIDDSSVKVMSDVKLLLLDAKPNEKKTVSVLRGNKKLQKNIILQ